LPSGKKNLANLIWLIEYLTLLLAPDWNAKDQYPKVENNEKKER